MPLALVASLLLVLAEGTAATAEGHAPAAALGPADSHISREEPRTRLPGEPPPEPRPSPGMHRPVTAEPRKPASEPRHAPAEGLIAPKPGPEWKQVSANKDLVVYFRDVPAVNAREVRGFTEIAAPPETIFKTVTDFAHYTQFMPYTKDEQILQRISDHVVITYSLVTPPLIAPRDSVAEITMTPGTAENGYVYRSEWSARPALLPEKRGVVRIKVSEGYWILEPIDGGTRTRVTYNVLTNPGGQVPRMFLDMSTNQGLSDLFNSIRRRLEKQ